MIASGDLSNRCRPAELEEAQGAARPAAAPTLAVPGNHDIPYTLPARVTRPWEPFEAVFGTTDPVLRTPNAVVCGLNSGRPWRHQGGRLERRAPRVGRADPGRCARPARCGSWSATTTSRARPGAPRGSSRSSTATRCSGRSPLPARSSCSGATSTRARPSSGTRSRRWPTTLARSLVLSTAPGFGRPRPDRLGEANGLHVVRWTADEIEIETRIWRERPLRARMH